jgi:hypothetical protein
LGFLAISGKRGTASAPILFPYTAELQFPFSFLPARFETAYRPDTARSIAGRAKK